MMKTATNPLILASASPRRLQLLQQIGVTPEAVHPPEIDETPHKGELPMIYAARMAQEKSRAVAVHYPQDAVLAADTVVACGRRILPKAETLDEARACLQQLSGRRHRVLCAFSIRFQQQHVHRTISSLVQFKRLTQADIGWYLATGEWDGKAGGYAIQGAAQAFIKRLDGSYSAVVGLPLLEVRHALQHLRLI